MSQNSRELKTIDINGTCGGFGRGSAIRSAKTIANVVGLYAEISYPDSTQ